MPATKLLLVRLQQRFDGLFEHVERHPSVLCRVVAFVGEQLVALHQPVIWVAREGEGGQFQSVQHGPAQAFQLRQLVAHQRYVVALEVVAQKDLAVTGKAVEGYRHRGCSGRGTGAAVSIRVVRSDGADSKDLVALFRMGFNVDGNNSTLGGDAPSTCMQGVEGRRFQRRPGEQQQV